MASCVDFLRTGSLGSLSCGMSQDQVRNLLGEPEAVSTQRHPRIWKYGSLELTFYRLPDGPNPFLISISLYFHTPTSKLPDSLQLTGWSPSQETTLAEVREFLDVLILGSMVASHRADTNIWSWHPVFAPLSTKAASTA